MKIMGEEATRIHGSLSVTLADGREAALEVEIDVSDPRAFIEIQNHYDDYDLAARYARRPVRLLSQTFSIHWPITGDSVPAPLTIRIPIQEVPS